MFTKRVVDWLEECWLSKANSSQTLAGQAVLIHAASDKCQILKLNELYTTAEDLHKTELSRGHGGSGVQGADFCFQSEIDLKNQDGVRKGLGRPLDHSCQSLLFLPSDIINYLNCRT